ncbi:MAG: acyl-CoA dehydrogenase [Rhizobiaceae bacterium]
MYKAPIRDIFHALNNVAGLKSALDKGLLGDLSADLAEAVLEEAGRFAGEEIAPLRMIGDTSGAVLREGKVTTPPGWKELYRKWIDGGWNSLAGPQSHGGQGLPMMLSIAALEMWNSGSMGFAVGPTLTMGAVEALAKHGSEELKDAYLEKLVSGEWMGTMNLTEPQAGSDLSALKARAEPAGAGAYRIFGQKIFITYGEHDFTDNIVHLVLARLPDAPAGTRGISLFLVPKFLLNADGSLGARNDAFCQSLEHKLGIHGSPTCVMIYGDGKFGSEPGAIGFLVGEENRGLACMFTMMNNARLAIAIQGVAVAEAAFQKARAFASERRQGRAPGETGPAMSPILAHPDVKRMLLTMQALTHAARAICYACAHALDMAHAAQGGETQFWQERANLLTPLAKAFATDIGVEASSLGVQVHGGMGFIEETGAAVLLRDSRIAPIYEGTNGIQAIDLVTRKLGTADGHLTGLFAEMSAAASAYAASPSASPLAASQLVQSLEGLEETTAYMHRALAGGRMADALAGATPYLRQFALTYAAAKLAAGLIEADARQTAIFRFFAENLLAETGALQDRVLNGAASLQAASAILADH